MTFMIIDSGRCPACGGHGVLWKKKPQVFSCSDCKTFFNDFGIVLEAPNMPQGMVS